MNYIVRQPTEDDVEYMINNARPEDVAEVEALEGSTIRSAFEETPDLLGSSKIWEVDGNPVAIFGVTPVKGPMSIGVIWLIATDAFHKYTRKFARYCKEVLRDLIKGYNYVYNYIHAENKVSIEWLKWLGFKINEGQPIGHQGAIFHKFEMRNV